MMKTTCRYLALSELPDAFDATAYRGMVRPLDYEFDLIRGADYLIIGVVVREGRTWFYVAPDDGDMEIQIVPAVLFAFDKGKIPTGMVLRIVDDQRFPLEILPESLAGVEGWFERYIDEDETIIRMVESEIKRSP